MSIAFYTVSSIEGNDESRLRQTQRRYQELLAEKVFRILREGL